VAKIRKHEGKNGASYQIDYFDPNGKRVRQSCKKKKDAEAELAKRVSLIAEKRYLDVKKDYTTTLDELLDKYKENFQHQACFKNWKVFFKIYGISIRLPDSSLPAKLSHFLKLIERATFIQRRLTEIRKDILSSPPWPSQYFGSPRTCPQRWSLFPMLLSSRSCPEPRI
jgi:hypothetical protein